MTYKTYRTYNEQETQKLAAEFASGLRGGDVVFLQGDLGSGKTTFVRGVAEAFGFKEPVRSPSFTLVNHYPVSHGGIKQIVHVDFYRIGDSSEIAPLALEEDFGRLDTVAFIEWPEQAGDALSEPSQRIHFSICDSIHQIEIQNETR